MCEARKPIFGTVFDVVFFALIAGGVGLIATDIVEGRLEFWQNALLIAVALACLVRSYLGRRRRKARDRGPGDSRPGS